MRRLFALLLLLVLTYNVGGYAVVHGIMLHLNTERIIAMRAVSGDERGFVRVAIGNGDAKHSELFCDGEAVVDGRLLDVVHTVATNDSTIALCVVDGDEEAMLARIEAQVDKSGDSPQSQRPAPAAESPVKECAVGEHSEVTLIADAVRFPMAESGTVVLRVSSIPPPPPKV